MNRSRIFYGLLLILMIGLGLYSRRLSPFLPGFINTYLGDAIWAAMIYIGFAFLFNRRKPAVIVGAAAFYCLLTECSQLYQAFLINDIRASSLGGLVLGYGFLWTDLGAYAIGISVCAACESIAKKPSVR